MTTFSTSSALSQLQHGSEHALETTKPDLREVRNFAADLEGALKEIERAFNDTKLVGKEVLALQKELGDRSVFDKIFSLSSTTDKELATMVGRLGGSLELTQCVVRIMLRIQTQKGRLLHAFSDALVDKIAKIQGDTRTLDGNQKEAALAFLEELRGHVNEQMEQQRLVERHEVRVGEIDTWQREKESSDAELARRVVDLDREVESLSRQLELLEPRLAVLEASHQRARTLRGMFARDALSLVALITALAAAFTSSN